MTSSDIIATCSVLVAVLAFAATAYQAWVARHHNRLSVRPHLVWHIGRENASSGASISYSIRNLGLGPAIVSDRYFSKDGARFVPPGLQTDELPDFLQHIVGKRFEYNLKTYGLPGKKSAIPSQGEVVLAKIEFPGQSLVQVATILEVVGEIAFDIKYESLYGESFDLHVK